MSVEEVIQAALRRANELPKPPSPADAALERLRAECVAFFDEVPEPPLYRRVDDPIRAQAARQVPAGQELLARAERLSREPVIGPQAQAVAQALRSTLEALCLISAGRLEQAESAWQRSTEQWRGLSAARRIWKRTDEGALPVYARDVGVSRYDPRPEADVHVKLACPATGCQKIADYAFSPRHATHRFVCAACRAPFVAYFAEVQEAKSSPSSTSVRRFLFRVEELTGQQARVEFEDASGAEFNVARRDLLAFLYSDRRELRAVLDLSSSRLLWVRRGGPCFVATVAFGEEGPELSAFRAFRDEVLRRSDVGSALVRGYYRFGPALARVLARRAWPLAVTRWALRRVHRALEGRGPW